MPPDYESILGARLNGYPVGIQTMKYEYQRGGPGLMSPPVGSVYGLIDKGMVSLMSDLPEDGLAALTFTLGGGSVWGGDDAISMTYTTASNGRVTSSLTVGSGLTAGQTTATLTPASNITDVEAITYTGLPDRVLATQLDEDDNTILYAILLPGSGTARFRRYQVPQVPIGSSDEWILSTLLKRAFVPLSAVGNTVYLDNLTALRFGLLALIQDDQGNHEQGDSLWERGFRALDDELRESRGGAEGVPNIDIHGKGISAIPAYY